MKRVLASALGSDAVRLSATGPLTDAAAAFIVADWNVLHWTVAQRFALLVIGVAVWWALTLATIMRKLGS